MKPIPDRRFPANTRWQSSRTEWLWESGISYATQPINVTGVWVNNSFYPSNTTGVYQHYINYPLGQVVFNSAIPATSLVQVSHSERFVQVHKSDVPWFKQLVNRSFRTDDTQFTTPIASAGGGWAIFGENRIQLPSIVIEPTFNTSVRALEIGNTAGIYTEDFLFHVLAETPTDRKRLTDILKKQFDLRIQTFNKNEISHPLDAYGKLVPSATTYPQLINDFPWQKMTVKRVSSNDQPDLGNYLYWSTVRYCLEVDLP